MGNRRGNNRCGSVGGKSYKDLPKKKKMCVGIFTAVGCSIKEGAWGVRWWHLSQHLKELRAYEGDVDVGEEHSRLGAQPVQRP